MTNATEALAFAHSAPSNIYQLSDLKLATHPTGKGQHWDILFDRTRGPSFTWRQLTSKEQMEFTLLIEHTSG